jgi:hypothetical protein
VRPSGAERLAAPVKSTTLGVLQCAPLLTRLRIFLRGLRLAGALHLPP